MYILNLSYNAFTGAIPPSLSNIRKLKSSDLSVKSLNEQIPAEFAKLTFLSFLNLSNNHLVGRIPHSTHKPFWLWFVLEDFWEEQTTATTVFCDNTSAIAMAKNPIFHQRSKHIKRKFHFIRDAIQEGVIELLYCKGEEQIADIFTKALPKDRFSYLRSMLGVKSASTLERSVKM